MVARTASSMAAEMVAHVDDCRSRVTWPFWKSISKARDGSPGEVAREDRVVCAVVPEHFHRERRPVLAAQELAVGVRAERAHIDRGAFDREIGDRDEIANKVAGGDGA
jgi:hypothetical protein